MSDSLKFPKKVHPKEPLYSDPYQELYKIRADFDGFSKDFFIVDRGQRASVVVMKEDSVLLVRQYRFLIDRISLEVPSGKVDPGETPETAARRECLEETGVECGRMEPLIEFQPGVETLKHPSYVYLCRDFKDNGFPEAERAWMPLDECVKAVFSKEIVDSLSIIALLAAAQK